MDPWNGFDHHATLVLLALDYRGSLSLAFGLFYLISSRNQVLPFTVLFVHHAFDPTRHPLSRHVLHGKYTYARKCVDQFHHNLAVEKCEFHNKLRIPEAIGGEFVVTKIRDRC